MLINEVALGKCCDVFMTDTTLIAPPEGYDSVHGVGRKHDNASQFQVSLTVYLFQFLRNDALLTCGRFIESYLGVYLLYSMWNRWVVKDGDSLQCLIPHDLSENERGLWLRFNKALNKTGAESRRPLTEPTHIWLLVNAA